MENRFTCAYELCTRLIFLITADSSCSPTGMCKQRKVKTLVRSVTFSGIGSGRNSGNMCSSSCTEKRLACGSRAHHFNYRNVVSRTSSLSHGSASPVWHLLCWSRCTVNGGRWEDERIKVRIQKTFHVLKKSPSGYCQEEFGGAGIEIEGKWEDHFEYQGDLNSIGRKCVLGAISESSNFVFLSQMGHLMRFKDLLSDFIGEFPCGAAG